MEKLCQALCFLRAYVCACQTNVATQIERERGAEQETARETEGDEHRREGDAGACEDVTQSFVDHASFLQTPHGERDAEDVVQDTHGVAAAAPTISPRDSNLNPSTVADHADMLELYKTMLEVKNQRIMALECLNARLEVAGEEDGGAEGTGERRTREAQVARLAGEAAQLEQECGRARRQRSSLAAETEAIRLQYESASRILQNLNAKIKAKQLILDTALAAPPAPVSPTPVPPAANNREGACVKMAETGTMTEPVSVSVSLAVPLADSEWAREKEREMQRESQRQQLVIDHERKLVQTSREREQQRLHLALDRLAHRRSRCCVVNIFCQWSVWCYEQMRARRHLLRVEAVGRTVCSRWGRRFVGAAMRAWHGRLAATQARCAAVDHLVIRRWRKSSARWMALWRLVVALSKLRYVNELRRMRVSWEHWRLVLDVRKEEWEAEQDAALKQQMEAKQQELAQMAQVCNIFKTSHV